MRFCKYSGDETDLHGDRVGVIGRFWRRELETGFSRFRDRLTFMWSDALSLPDILERVEHLPSHSAIVYLSFGTDAQGGAYASEQVIAGLHARANAPIFGAQSPAFGSGIVGGSLVSINDLAHRTAGVASRILSGEPAESLRVAPQFAGSADVRLARVEAVGNSRDSVAAGQRRDVSRPYAVGGTQSHRARRRCARWFCNRS